MRRGIEELIKGFEGQHEGAKLFIICLPDDSSLAVVGVLD